MKLFMINSQTYAWETTTASTTGSACDINIKPYSMSKTTVFCMPICHLSQ